MRDFIVELLEGTIDPLPFDKRAGTNLAYGKAAQAFEECEHELRKNLEEEQLAILETLIVAKNDMERASIIENYVADFRIGARAMLAALTND